MERNDGHLPGRPALLVEVSFSGTVRTVRSVFGSGDDC
jgi:hypothetical protein